MKVIKLATAIVTILGVSACSNGPSEGDAKKAVQNIIGNCPTLSLGRFAKTNGIAQGDNLYEVSVTYTINQKEDHEYIKLANELNPKIEQLEKQIKIKHDAYEVAEVARQNIADAEESRVYYENNSVIANEVSKLRDELAIMKNKLDAAKYGPMLACPFIGLLGFEAQQVGSRETTHPINMIKTDNGWIAR